MKKLENSSRFFMEKSRICIMRPPTQTRWNPLFYYTTKRRDSC
ncbi:hypothetical protein [Acidaminococcus intestini]